MEKTTQPAAGRKVEIAVEHFPIAGRFVISRGARTEAEVVTCTLSEAGRTGRGECVPYARYGETLEGVRGAIEAARPALEAGIGREDLLSAMPAGAARNAVDCALWDLEAKLSGRPVHALLGAAPPRPLVTAVTISLGLPDEMVAQAAALAHLPLLKVKVGAPGDAARIRAVAAAAPKSRIVLDANEGWNEDTLLGNLAVAHECGVALVEQPLPAGKDGLLAGLDRPVPICADESVHSARDLDRLVGRYDAINIKLDKAGGLTAALLLRERARELGFAVMVGCMVGTSLAMAPAVLLAQDADFVDLDGPLLLARDRAPGLAYDGATVAPPGSELWG